MPDCDLAEAYQSLIHEATRLAGGLNDLSQRATVYHHLYEHSGGNHIFPLIAAHGALWARDYFAFGMRLGDWLLWQYAGSRRRRERAFAALRTFADAFRDINRRVCIDTYASYHFAAAFGRDPRASQFVSPELLTALLQIHEARRGGITLSDKDKREIFRTHFLNEQETVVGPSIANAVEDFDWPLMKLIALRPVIQFAFFPTGRRFWFRNFASRSERICKGLCAFDLAAEVGWSRVESSLRRYEILPDAFFAGSARHFAALRGQLPTTG